MGMCKECGKVFNVLDMKDGVCKNCKPFNKTIDLEIVEEAKKYNLTINLLITMSAFIFTTLLIGFFVIDNHYSKIMIKVQNTKPEDIQAHLGDKQYATEVAKAVDWECFKGDEGKCEFQSNVARILFGDESNHPKWWNTSKY